MGNADSKAASRAVSTIENSSITTVCSSSGFLAPRRNCPSPLASSQRWIVPQLIPCPRGVSASRSRAAALPVGAIKAIAAPELVSCISCFTRLVLPLPAPPVTSSPAWLCSRSQSSASTSCCMRWPLQLQSRNPPFAEFSSTNGSVLRAQISSGSRLPASSSNGSLAKARLLKKFSSNGLSAAACCCTKAGARAIKRSALMDLCLDQAARRFHHCG